MKDIPLVAYLSALRSYKAEHEVAYIVGPRGHLVATKDKEQHGNKRQSSRDRYHHHTPCHFVPHDLLDSVVVVWISTVSTWIRG
jgi:hypothetical protein